jgi:hypothetical protein
LEEVLLANEEKIKTSFISPSLRMASSSSTKPSKATSSRLSLRDQAIPTSSKSHFLLSPQPAPEDTCNNSDDEVERFSSDDGEDELVEEGSGEEEIEDQVSILQQSSSCESQDELLEDESDEEVVRRKVVRKRVVESPMSDEDFSGEDEDLRVQQPWPQNKKISLVGKLISEVCFQLDILLLSSLIYVYLYRLGLNQSPEL